MQKRTLSNYKDVRLIINSIADNISKDQLFIIYEFFDHGIELPPIKDDRMHRIAFLMSTKLSTGFELDLSKVPVMKTVRYRFYRTKKRYGIKGESKGGKILMILNETDLLIEPILVSIDIDNRSIKSNVEINEESATDLLTILSSKSDADKYNILLG